jgi:hypothetical protein
LSAASKNGKRSRRREEEFATTARGRRRRSFSRGDRGTAEALEEEALEEPRREGAVVEEEGHSEGFQYGVPEAMKITIG